MVDLPSSETRPPAVPISRRILVVDDNVDFADSLSAILALEGHEPRVAYDGESALEMVRDQVRDHGFDIVLLDLRLPGKNGREVLHDVLQMAPGTRVILVTGVDASALPTDLVGAGGASAVLRKPVNLESLLPLLA